MRKKLITILFASFVFIFNPINVNAMQTTPMIIDTDMAVDDWMAIGYILQSPKIEVKAISIVGTGATHCKSGVINARKILALAGKSFIPVACGTNRPLKGNHLFPNQWRIYTDTLLGIHLAEKRYPSKQPPYSAVKLMAETLQKSKSKITILAIGPATNLAKLVTQYPSIKNKIKMVYMMGGAIHVPGNVYFAGIDNKVAEWNIYLDPYAMSLLLNSGVPITLVPLDATNKIPLNRQYYNRIAENHHTRIAKFVYQALTKLIEEIPNHKGLDHWYFWDPLAALIASDESLATFKNYKLQIVQSPESKAGQTKIVPNGISVRVATSADAKRAKRKFLAALNIKSG